MFFWVTAGLLTIAAILAVLLPLTRKAGDAEPAERHDLEVYKDQLAEVDRDAARGALSSAEAEEARVEISRRILKLGEAAHAPTRRGSNFSRVVGLAAVLSVPLVAWGFYGAIGSPDLPAQPLQARLDADPADSSVDELVARAEAHLAANPDDGRGWDVIAPVYLRLGRPDASVIAYRNAIRLAGATAQREAGLGEALTQLANGAINDEASAAFERALKLEPGHAKSIFYLATADAQQGRFEAATDRWTVLLASLPADSPWRQPTERALSEVSAELAKAGNAPGPTQDDIDAAAAMPAEDQKVMIEGMVAGLDAKLRENPDDGEGWQRLVRSYVVLGRKDDAQAALDRGLKALDGGAADALAGLATSLGLTVQE
jgi:cytochrome c-type biogenesis protein CcmH